MLFIGSNILNITTGITLVVAVVVSTLNVVNAQTTLAGQVMGTVVVGVCLVVMLMLFHRRSIQNIATSITLIVAIVVRALNILYFQAAFAGRRVGAIVVGMGNIVVFMFLSGCLVHFVAAGIALVVAIAVIVLHHKIIFSTTYAGKYMTIFTHSFSSCIIGMLITTYNLAAFRACNVMQTGILVLYAVFIASVLVCSTAFIADTVVIVVASLASTSQVDITTDGTFLLVTTQSDRNPLQVMITLGFSC